MTKDEKERRAEEAAFCRRKALQWKNTQDQLQAVLNQMDDNCQFGEVYTNLEFLIGQAKNQAAEYWKYYYKAIKK